MGTDLDGGDVVWKENGGGMEELWWCREIKMDAEAVQRESQ
jgi:hypothetical protein